MILNFYYYFNLTLKKIWLIITKFVGSTVRYSKIENFFLFSILLPFCKIQEDNQTVFVSWLKNNFSNLNLNMSLFEMHTKGSGFTLKLIIIILLLTILLFFLNVNSFKSLTDNSKTFFFNPFILWVLAWIVDILILLIRVIFFKGKFLDLQFIFVPSILVWIFFRIFFFKKTINENFKTDFLDDWINYQLKFKPAKFFFEKISKNKDINKSKLFYLSTQIFFLDSTICTLRILIYGCLILGRLDFTISFFLFVMMVYIYKKKLKNK